MVSLLCCFFPGSPRDKPHATVHGDKQLVLENFQSASADPPAPAAKQQPIPCEDSFPQLNVPPSDDTLGASPDPRPSPSSNTNPAPHSRPRFSLQHQLSQLQTQLKEEQARNPWPGGTRSSSLHAALSASGTWDPVPTPLSRDSRVYDLIKRGSSHLLDRTSSLLDTPSSPCLRQDSSRMQARPFHSPPTTDPKGFGRPRAITDMGSHCCRAQSLGPPLFSDHVQALIAMSRRSSLKVDGLPLPLPRTRGSSSRDFLKSGLDLHPAARMGSGSGPARRSTSGCPPKSGCELLRLHSAIMLQLNEVNGMSPTSERRLQMHKSRSLRSGSMSGAVRSSLGYSGSPPVTGPGSSQVHDATAAARKPQQGRAPCPLPPAAGGAKPPMLAACTEGSETLPALPPHCEAKAS